MRAAPAIQVSLNRFGAWRVAMLVLALLAGLTVVGWLAGQEALVGTRRGFAMFAAAALLLWLGVSLARVHAMELRWDGQCWALRPMLPAGTDPVVGEISVAVDVGPWMLLRFRPRDRSRWTQATWLPVQRWGMTPQWHALRCAVYSPRPLAAADVSAPP